jgi:hypothetical protein
MRSVVLTTLVAVALAISSGLAAAAQDPPEPAKPGAVRRGDRIQSRDGETSRSAPDSQGERRGAVRAVPRSESNGTETSRPVIRSEAPPASIASASDDAEEQRRGAVRRPPSSPRGESGDVRTRDRAVPRTSAAPRDRGGDRVYVYNYPYRYRRYYDLYYNPWAYGFGLGYYYAPWGWGPGYGPGYHGYGGYGYDDIGSVRLKVSPRDAEVFVDNYFAGYVDDFDGIFQSLKLQVGGHRIEIRKAGLAPLQFDVHVQPDRKVTFRGEMRPAVP